MITTKPLTLEEFLSMPEGYGDITYELVDGVAIPKMAPKRFYSRLTGTIFTLLNNWSKDQGEVGIEWAIVLKKDGRDWVPVPDLLYLSYQRLPRDRFEDEACPIPPDLVIEIISPSQSFSELSKKANDYLKAGVLRVWVVDPKTKTITVFTPNSLPETKRRKDRLSDSILPGLQLTVEQVFQKAGLL